MDAANSEARPSESQAEVQPEPPRATPDLVASLLTPSPRPRIGGPASAVAAMPPQLPKPKRTPRAKVTSMPEPAPVLPAAASPDPAPEPIASGKKKPGPRPKLSKDTSGKEKAKKPVKEAPEPKAARAKKVKAE